MSAHIELASGLEFYELSHPWEHNQPVLPGFDEMILYRSVNHAKHGVMSQMFKTVFHTSTHINAPIHLIQRGKGVGELALNHFWGSAAILPIPKQKWELVTSEDLENFSDSIKAGDIVIINTRWHTHYSDSQDYFGHAPGLCAKAAQCLLTKK